MQVVEYNYTVVVLLNTNIMSLVAPLMWLWYHVISYDVIQGMNMLVAVGLLFLDEETTFWLLMMIIEKMTPQDYYSPGLLGAQADQVCTKWSIIVGNCIKDKALFILLGQL